MLSVKYAECHKYAHHAECRYTKFRYAECHNAECHYAECRYAEYHYEYFHYAECGYAECHYEECHYAECHYAEHHCAECRYAECHVLSVLAPLKVLHLSNTLAYYFTPKSFKASAFGLELFVEMTSRVEHISPKIFCPTIVSLVLFFTIGL
jgi:hypothetical protein